MEELKCKICGFDSNDYKGLSTHVRKEHGMWAYEYYYKYLYENSKCPQCGKNLEWYGSLQRSLHRFCSKSCEMKYENNKRLKNGTHNFMVENGGNELRDSIRKELLKSGKHPFQNGNMSEDALKKKHEGIRLARNRETELGKHPWQSAKSRINNEKSRLLSVLSDKLDSIYQIYIADTDFNDYFKFGVSYNIDIRRFDNRTYELKNLVCIRSMKVSDAIELEYQLKLKYLDESNYKLTGSYEMIPVKFKDEVINFINNYPVK